MGEIVMPRLTDSMEEGVVLAWLKSDGDEVAVGDELVEIETDKASMVYESDLAGTLRILVPEGETRPIGEPIAFVGDEASANVTGVESVRDSAGGADPDGGPAGRTSPGVPSDPPTTSAQQPALDDRPGTRVNASPLARRIAADKGVDLSSLSGSGPGGRIIKVDVESAPGAADVGPGVAASAKTPPADSAKGAPEIVELTRTQQLIARRMSESKATIPHFYLRTIVDMDRAVEVRTAFKEAAAEGETVPSLNDFIVKAVAIALKRHPKANAAFRDGHFELYPKVNVGIAVASGGALIVPVIMDADHLTLAEISDASRLLAQRVRSGEVTPPVTRGFLDCQRVLCESAWVSAADGDAGRALADLRLHAPGLGRDAAPEAGQERVVVDLHAEQQVQRRQLLPGRSQRARQALRLAAGRRDEDPRADGNPLQRRQRRERAEAGGHGRHLGPRRVQAETRARSRARAWS